MQHGINGWQVAPGAINIHTETKDETVWYGQPDKIGRNRLGFAVELVGKHRRQNLFRPHAAQAFLDRCQRYAFIENVVDNQYRAALDRSPRGATPGNFAALRIRPITGGVKIIELKRKIELRQQLTAEDDAASHDTEDQRIFLAQTGADLSCHPADGGADFFC